MQEYIVKINRKGTELWHNKNGQLHREGDKPAVIYSNGDKCWCKNGKLHRENNPAVVYYDGGEAWYLNGQQHREGGPAVICTDGREEYWFNGVWYPNPNTTKELTVADIEELLGYRVKIVK
jgi:hypothetical protein